MDNVKALVVSFALIPAVAFGQSVSVGKDGVSISASSNPSLKAAAAKHGEADKQVAPQPFMAQEAPASVGGTIQEFVYHPNTVYRIRTKAGMFTNIEAPAGEKILGFYLSDTVFWKFVVAKDGARVFVRPSEDGRVNAGTMVTDKRVYELEFAALPVTEPYWHKRVQWAHENDNFPGWGMFADPGEAVGDGQSKTLLGKDADTGKDGRQDWTVNVEKANFNYRVSKSDVFSPSMVFDDGVFTYMKFPTLQDMPAIFAFDKDPGKARLVDYVVRGSNVIIHRVAEGGFLLKLGERTVVVERF